MPTLQTDVGDLLRLYPRHEEGLDVVTPVNVPSQLDIIYLQRNMEDPRRDWVLYDKWKRENDEHIIGQEGEIKTGLPLPDNFDSIYHHNMNLIGVNDLIKPEDKILLTINLGQCGWDSQYRDVTTSLGWIQRNYGSDLKGLGGEIYGKLQDFLRTKGYRFLIALPMGSTLARYWQGLGLVPIERIESNKTHLLLDPHRPANILIGFLYEEDRNRFVTLE